MKVSGIHDLARAALDGRLDTERLRALPEDEALAELQDTPRCRAVDRAGDPARGCGVADAVPLVDDISRTAVAAALRPTRAARRRDLDADLRRLAPVPDVGHRPAPHGLAPRTSRRRRATASDG